MFGCIMHMSVVAPFAMSGDNDEDIGFTQVQQDWIRELIASQQRDHPPPPARTRRPSW